VLFGNPVVTEFLFHNNQIQFIGCTLIDERKVGSDSYTKFGVPADFVKMQVIESAPFPTMNIVPKAEMFQQKRVEYYRNTW
jgi:hypothetical protein